MRSLTHHLWCEAKESTKKHKDEQEQKTGNIFLEVGNVSFHGFAFAAFRTFCGYSGAFRHLPLFQKLLKACGLFCSDIVVDLPLDQAFDLIGFFQQFDAVGA